MKTKFFFILLIFTVKLFAQDDRQPIEGTIYNDSVWVDNVHIINKNTNYGTISNQIGKFKIPVKINDTLQFSGIQFFTKTVIITKEILNTKTIAIKLTINTNELDEVEVKSNPFTGNLVTDVEKVNVSSNVTDGVLDFSNINFAPITSDFDNDNSGKPPDASKLTNPHIPIGLNLLKIGLGKPFKKKRRPVQILIREKFGDDFFINTLSIPRIHIDVFLNHCKNKGITKLYKTNKKLEFTDAILKESKVYLTKIKKEE